MAAALVGSWLATDEVQAKDYYGPNGDKLPYTPVVTLIDLYSASSPPVVSFPMPSSSLMRLCRGAAPGASTGSAATSRR